MGRTGLRDAGLNPRNRIQHMFGKHRIREIVRSHSLACASEILSVAINELGIFQQHRKTADDVTLLVLNLTV